MERFRIAAFSETGDVLQQYDGNWWQDIMLVTKDSECCPVCGATWTFLRTPHDREYFKNAGF